MDPPMQDILIKYCLDISFLVKKINITAPFVNLVNILSLCEVCRSINTKMTLISKKM